MANQRPPAWFRLSSMVNRPPTPTSEDPTPPPPPIYARPPPLPIPALVRPSFPTETEKPIPPPPPLTILSFLLPAVALPRPPVSTPVRSPVPTTPTPARPMSSVLAPVSGPAPPRSSIPPPVSAVAPPRSPVSVSTMAAAPPPSLPAAIRSPVLPPTSPPRARYATPPPTSITPPSNSTSPVTYKISPSYTQTKIDTLVSSRPNSPISKHVSTVSSIDTANGKASAPVSNPKEMNSSERNPPRSPIIKPLSRSPSPLTLPPAQLNTNSEREPNVEQKTVLLEETTGKPMKMSNSLNNASFSNEKKEPVKHNKGTTKKINNPHELGTTVITLAGENKGAVMELSPSQRKKYSMGNPHSLNNTKPGSSSGDQSSTESGEEGTYRNNDKTKKGMTMQPMTQYLNSNVQGVNNSVLYNFTYTQNDPGVHLSLNRKANGSRHKE